MEFLVIVVALALHKAIPNLRLLHEDRWYFQWLSNLGEQPLTAFKFGVSLLLPVLVALLIGNLIHRWGGGLALFVYTLFMLLYALGRGNLPACLNTLEEHVEREDQQAVYHDTEQLNRRAINTGDNRVIEVSDVVQSADENEAQAGAIDSTAELHRELLQSLSYRFFEHAFPVIFWFAILGIPGAVLYRLSELQANRSNGQSTSSVEGIAQRWLWLMEWLPVRLLGFTFALVGNFACCMHYWRECVVCPIRTTGQILLHYVVGALSANVESADIEVAELAMVKQLFFRAMILWVCVIALLVVL